jgi:hypothetical protein
MPPHPDTQVSLSLRHRYAVSDYLREQVESDVAIHSLGSGVAVGSDETLDDALIEAVWTCSEPCARHPPRRAGYLAAPVPLPEDASPL